MIDVLVAKYTVIALAAGVPAVLFGFVVAALEPKKDIRGVILLLVGVAVIGAVAGTSGGLSRVGAVGDIIPAALALLGGVSVYLFGANKPNGAIVSVCAAVFALSLGGGYTIGAADRSKSDAVNLGAEFCIDLLKEPDVYASESAYQRVILSNARVCTEFLDLKFSQSGIPVNFEDLMKQGMREALAVRD